MHHVLIHRDAGTPPISLAFDQQEGEMGGNMSSLFEGDFPEVAHIVSTHTSWGESILVDTRSYEGEGGMF